MFWLIVGGTLEYILYTKKKCEKQSLGHSSVTGSDVQLCSPCKVCIKETVQIGWGMDNMNEFIVNFGKDQTASLKSELIG